MSPQLLWMEGNKERGEDESDSAQQLDDDVQRGPGGVLERVADGIADDARLVSRRALPEYDTVLIFQIAGFDVSAIMMPVIVATISNPAAASGPIMDPTKAGVPTTRIPGMTIWRSAALVLMSTHLA